MKAERPAPRVHEALPHDSAALHVSGEARYVDDLPEPPGTLYAAFGMSTETHAKIRRHGPRAGARGRRRGRGARGRRHSRAPTTSARCCPTSRCSPPGSVQFRGQPLFAVAADERRARAPRGAPGAASSTSRSSRSSPSSRRWKSSSSCCPTSGASAAAWRTWRARCTALKGRLRCGAPGALLPRGPGRARDPGRARRDAGALLDPASERGAAPRRGGARRARRRGDRRAAAARRRLRRQGNAGRGVRGRRGAARARHRPAGEAARRPRRRHHRHRQAPRFPLPATTSASTARAASRRSTSCSPRAAACRPTSPAAVNDRAVFHCDNAYFLPNVRIVSHRCKTNTVSSTAFRGFGGPQGMFAIEARRSRRSRAVSGIDPLDVRKRNLYGAGAAQRHALRHDAEGQRPARARSPSSRPAPSTASAREARDGLQRFNSAFFKRGLALTPVKFGIAFTAMSMNQAGALVHLYTDGSVHLNHGGTEMGQGLMIKVAQIVADGAPGRRSSACTSPPPPPARCRTPRPPRPPAAPTSTARRRATPAAP